MTTIEKLQEQINTLLKQIQSLQEELAEINKDKNIKEGVNNMGKSLSDSDKLEIRIVPDSSWLIAILDEKDTHHISATSSLGAILPYKPVFYIPAIIYLETISRLIRVNKIQVQKCEHKIDKFLQKISYKHSKFLEIAEILKNIKLFHGLKFQNYIL